MSFLITMSQKELHRLELIQKIRDERLSVVQAAEQLDLSRSQVHRLLPAYDRDGPAGLVQKQRSRPSNRRHSEAFRNAALDLIRERYVDFGPTLAREKLIELHRISVAKETLRQWMTEAGIWVSRRERKKRVFQPRGRRDCFGGLVGSFGTHGKPFHAGKAAMDGILAADLAVAGHVAAQHLFEHDKGWLDAFIQDRQVEVPPLDFDARSELLRNGYKLFANCRATHASSQAAMTLAGRFDHRRILSVRARVHAGAPVTAGNPDPKTPLEAKFSVAFCVAMALAGYRLHWTDFTDAVFGDERVISVIPKVSLEPVDGQSPASAFTEISLDDGSIINAETAVILGHPENPVSDHGLEEKFQSLVEPVLGPLKSKKLLDAAWHFGQPRTVETISRLLAGD